MAADVERWRLEVERENQARKIDLELNARLEQARMAEMNRFTPWDPFGKSNEREAIQGDTHKRRRAWGQTSKDFVTSEPLAPSHRLPVFDVNHPKQGVNPARVWEHPLDGSNERSWLDGFGAPGAGAPLRDAQGNIITSKPTHTELIMQANIVGKRSFLNAAPPVYVDADKAVKYKKELDEQFSQKQERTTKERQREIALELQRGGIFEFGGNDFEPDPLRSHRMTQKKQNKVHEAGDTFEIYDPFGKGIPERDADGNVKRHKHSNMYNGIIQLDGEVDRGYEHEKAFERGMQRRPNRVKVLYNQYGEQALQVLDEGDQLENIWDPFGKPGCGAPRRDDNGNVLTRIPRITEEDPVLERQKFWSNKVYLDVIKDAIQDHEVKKASWDIYDKTGAENFADQVYNSKVGKIPRDPNTGFIQGTPRHATDITRPEVRDFDAQAEIPVRAKYYEDLKKQIEEKARVSQEAKIRDRIEAQQHYSTEDQSWGRSPGAANPNQPIKSKAPPLKKLLAAGGKGNDPSMYDLMTMSTGEPRRPFNPEMNQHASSAQIRRAFSEGGGLDSTTAAAAVVGDANQEQSNSNSDKGAPAAVKDPLYVPSGGIGWYAQDLKVNNSLPVTNSSGIF